MAWPGASVTTRTSFATLRQQGSTISSGTLSGLSVALPGDFPDGFPGGFFPGPPVIINACAGVLPGGFLWKTMHDFRPHAPHPA